jgi:hypothetical protein
VAFAPLGNKEFFKNYYGTNGVCFPLHSEDTGSTGAQIYSVVIFLGKKSCIASLPGSQLLLGYLAVWNSFMTSIAYKLLSF